MSDTEAAARAGLAAGRTAGGGRRGMRARARDWLVIVLPVAVTLAVGGYHLGGASLWRDEAYTREVVVRSPGQIIALLGNHDAVHGTYYLMMHEVTGLIGISETALRLPSLLAMAIAAGFTAATGRRLAAIAGGPAPVATGLLAGLVFATAPQMTWYAQDARAYAIVTMFACVATWLLLRAAASGRRGWWAGYGAAIALAGFFNLFSVLIVIPHGLSLLIARLRVRQGRPTRGESPAAQAAGDARIRILPARRLATRWLAAVVAAGIVLIPLGLVAYRERAQIGWLGTPTYKDVVALVNAFAGSNTLVLPVAVLAVGGALAGFLAGRSRPFSPGTIALPWLVVPPAILLGVSLVHPVYDARYIQYCLPALAILVAAGLVWLGRLAALTPLSRARLAWLPSAVVAAGLALLLVAPQQSVRLSSARDGNLRLISHVVATHERPGDVVFYVPYNAHVLGQGYPAPFRKLRDLAEAESPVASDSLNGTKVSPAALRSRFRHVSRVWVVSGSDGLPAPGTPIAKEEMALISKMHLVHRWIANGVSLYLYTYTH